MPRIDALMRRRIAIGAIEILIVGLTLPAFLLRIIYLLVSVLCGLRKLSVWTGAPIINKGINARAERKLGFNSISIVRDTFFITDNFDINIAGLVFGKGIGKAVWISVLQLALLTFASQVHAYADGGLMPARTYRTFNPVELALYRFFRIKLFVWTYGSDVRTEGITRSLGDPNCCSFCPAKGQHCLCSDATLETNLLTIKKTATAIFSMGDMAHYVPGSRNDLFYWPVDFESIDSAIETIQEQIPDFVHERSQRPLTVVHAPNHRELKGTHLLQKAVNELRAEGVAIRLELVEGLSNQDALRKYKQADIIFDQCLIGFHGYFALEALALGKPVMCYIRKPGEYLIAPEECPIINVSAMDLKQALANCSTNRHLLGEIGKLGRNYVEKYYTTDQFAARLNVAYLELGVLK